MNWSVSAKPTYIPPPLPSQHANYKRLALSAFLPVRTVSEANRREHWAQTATRRKRHRTSAAMLVGTKARVMRAVELDSAPVLVRLTRLSQRKLDSDNLAAALKAVRDGVADGLGRTDDTKGLEWVVEQAQTLKGEAPGVFVEVWLR
jgi:hypothetical protein